MPPPILLLAGMLAVASAVAQERPPLQPLPELPPPDLPDTTHGSHVTITTHGEDKVEEYRIGGRLYAVKVTPPHGRPYYLVDIRGDGQLVRYDDLCPSSWCPCG